MFCLDSVIDCTFTLDQTQRYIHWYWFSVIYNSSSFYKVASLKYLLLHQIYIDLGVDVFSACTPFFSVGHISISDSDLQFRAFYHWSTTMSSLSFLLSRLRISLGYVQNKYWYWIIKIKTFYKAFYSK
jgi:hypothetical protein